MLENLVSQVVQTKGIRYHLLIRTKNNQNNLVRKAAAVEVSTNYKQPHQILQSLRKRKAINISYIPGPFLEKVNK